MENFIAYNPTRIVFGKGSVDSMQEHINNLGKRVLIMYGKGSSLKNGSYNDVISQCKKLNLTISEYSGIKSNPLTKNVDEAIQLGIKQQVDFIIAIGGGSVIDSAKITAIGIAHRANAWDIMKSKLKVDSALPLVTVLTLAATGTEMNPIAVLQDIDSMEKTGFGHPVIFPQTSFLDPQYTLSVPASYTSYGIADLTAHSLENFFSRGNSSLSDRFIISIINEAVEYGPLLMKNLSSYELRAKIMWAATNALNGMTLPGKGTGDWAVHAIGHSLSLLYDTPHGASLTIVYPAWLRFMKQRIPERIAELGNMLFTIKNEDAAIAGIEAFFSKINCPVRLEQIGIGREKKDEILKNLNQNNASGRVYNLDENDREAIVDLMYER